MGVNILEELGAKSSISEEHGLALIKDTDMTIFSPGISTAGFAEIRMAQGNPNRKIVATTIDQKGLDLAKDMIGKVGLQGQIDTRLEDLRDDWVYPENHFDYIYARLVLHYLSQQDLDKVLAGFSKSLKSGGRAFIVVRSVKNVDYDNPDTTYDEETKLTKKVYRGKDGEIEGQSVRYFHTPESISEHLKKAGLEVGEVEEYQEQLYKDFARKEISPRKDHLIEVVATKN